MTKIRETTIKTEIILSKCYVTVVTYYFSYCYFNVRLIPDGNSFEVSNLTCYANLALQIHFVRIILCNTRTFVSKSKLTRQ